MNFFSPLKPNLLKCVKFTEETKAADYLESTLIKLQKSPMVQLTLNISRSLTERGTYHRIDLQKVKS